MKHGFHVVKSWSTTQAVVALSSAEAELYSLTKGASQTLGVISLLKDFGIQENATIHTDASATIGIVHRQGLGKLRHLNVQYLWIQDKVKNKELKVTKVCGKENPADMLTKHVPAHDVEWHLASNGMYASRDRARIAPELNAVRENAFVHDRKPMHSRNKLPETAQEAWHRDGLKLQRSHGKARRTLFTPTRVAGSPPAKALTNLRITTGHYLDDGEEFTMVDAWTSRPTAHRDLGRYWLGSTTFVLKNAHED